MGDICLIVVQQTYQHDLTLSVLSLFENCWYLFVKVFPWKGSPMVMMVEFCISDINRCWMRCCIWHLCICTQKWSCHFDWFMVTKDMEETWMWLHAIPALIIKQSLWGPHWFIVGINDSDWDISVFQHFSAYYICLYLSVMHYYFSITMIDL